MTKRADAFRLGSAGGFLVCVLYGYVWIGVTLPLSMLALPLVFLAYADKDLFTNVPRGALLLLGIVVPVALQGLIGHPLAGKPDAVVFLPVAYAVATVIAWRRVDLTDRQLRLSLEIGGLVTCAVLAATVMLLPPGKFLIPGQDALRTQQLYLAAKDERLKRGASPDAADAQSVAADLGSFDRRATEAEAELYQQKAIVRSALGRSNTIAWYLVFLFSACLFSGHWWLAALFGGVALATLTRFAVVFLIGVVTMWLAWRRGIGLRTLASVSAAGGLVVVATLVVLKRAEVLLPISLDARVWYWTSALQVFAAHPLIGRPRSNILSTFDLSIVWTPCNGFLWVSVVTGIIGAAFYLAFVLVALAEICRRASTSRLWAGLFIGFVTLLTWNLFEPIAFTPTFDMLLAAHYAMARRARGVSGFAA